MIRELLDWVAPGVVTVVGGTAIALVLMTPGVLDRLDRQGAQQLRQGGFSWAHLQMDGRDAQVRGTVSTPTERDAAVAALAAIPGLRTIADDITIAPLASPYRLDVSVENGAISLSGSVPNEATRAELASRAGVARADLAIRSGQPDEAVWRQAVDVALSQAAQAEDGHFEVSGLTINAAARARSERALGTMQMAMASLPPGVAPGSVDLQPMLIAPYTWSAEFDGSRIAISGHVPEEQLVERYHTAALAGLPVATGLSLASGAPDGFAENSRKLIEQLAQLQSGQASIVDGVSRLSGTPPTLEVAQAVTNALSGSGAIVQLQPPPVSDYWMSVSRQAGGVLVFDGYVPDEATRAAFSEVPGADVNYLKFGGGAPQVYRRAADFGLSLLARLSEGRFSLRGNELSLSGTAASPTDYRSLIAALSTSVPQGVVLGQVDYKAPPAATYTFSLRRQADGYVTIAGMLPNPDMEKRVREQAGPLTTADITYASGEPTNFAAGVDQALKLLPLLARGEVRFDGTRWIVSGTPKSTIDKAAIDTEFSVQGLARSGWELALSAPSPQPQAVSPYIWSAEKLGDGSYILAGNVPAQALKAYLSVHAAGRVTDTSKVSLGAPDGFRDQAIAAIDALIGLSEGRAAFDGTQWTLAGTAPDAAAAEAVTSLSAARLGATPDITLPAAAAPAVSSPPPVEPSTPEPEVAAGPTTAKPSTPAPEPAATAPATPEAEPAPPPEPVAVAPAAPEPDPASLALCRDQLAVLSGHNAILFQSGAAIIAESAAAELDAFAAALGQCPASPVYVAGHTDSDGDDAKNLALSVARAEAVVGALVARGVDASRLYAIGFGETQPVADNDTPDGKRQNRRIVVTVDDPLD